MHFAKSSVLLLCLTVTITLHAQHNFLYTNNDVFPANNISGYSVGSTGTATPLAGSPFLTGGEGTGAPSDSTVAVQKITTARNFLYASNSQSSNISAFRIHQNGTLIAVPGSPFATGILEDCFSADGVPCEGIPLAASPDERYLFAAHPGQSKKFPGSSELYAYRIAENGALVPVPGSPFNAGGQRPFYLKVTPDGRFLAVILDLNVISMFRIGVGGSLSPVPGSPFPVASPVALEFNCSGEMFVAELGPIIQTFKISRHGELETVAQPPVSPRASFETDLLLSRDRRHLFESNLFEDEVSIFDVSRHQSLTEEPFSPTATGGGTNFDDFAARLALNKDGTLLYVSLISQSRFAIMAVGRDATLRPLTVTSTGQSGVGNNALTAYPRREQEGCNERDNSRDKD